MCHSVHRGIYGLTIAGRGLTLDPSYGETSEFVLAMTSATMNGLLLGLQGAARYRVRRHLGPVRLPLGKVLYEPGVELDSVYFPTTAIVSLHHELADGTCAEIAVVGNEGILGIALFMGGETTSSRAVVDS